MAKLGHVGYQTQIVIDRGIPVILCWGPRTTLVRIEDAERLLSEIEEVMTERREHWTYWQDWPFDKLTGG